MYSRTINEAARFGGKERDYILNNAHDFKIGLEFEFEVDEGLDYVEAVDKRPSGLIAFEEKTHKIISQIAQGNTMLLSFLTGSNKSFVDYTMGEASDIIIAPTQQDIDYFVDSTLSEVIKLASYGKVIISASVLYNQFDKKNTLIGFGGWDDPSGKIMQTVQTILKYDDVVQLSVQDSTPLLKASIVFLSDVEDHIKLVKKYSSLNVLQYTKMLTDEANKSYTMSNNEQSDNKVTTQTKVEYVKKTNPLPSSWVYDVVFDATVIRGVELITKPVDIKSIEKILDLMSDYIKKVGRTTKSTGLHVNISKGKNKFNPVKAITMLDPEFFQGLTGNSHVHPKYKPRFMVDSIVTILSDNLDKFALSYLKIGANGLIMMYEDILQSFLTKNYAINLSTLLRNPDIKSQRIEFRFFGGEDYEYRTNEIYNDILNTMYVIAISTDNQVGAKQYIQNIIRFLNRAAMATPNTDKDFSDTVNRVRMMRK